MKSKRMNKRGVSPLIATVLLIAFAVALGAVVMNWGRSYVQETASNIQETTASMACGDVSIEIPIIEDKQKICFDNTTSEIRFVLYNNGARIEGMKFSIIGDKNVDNPTSLIDYPVERAKTISEKVSYNQTVGEIKKIKIIPRIVDQGQESFCTLSAANIDYVSAC
jgi:flagellin-like protein